MPDTATPAVDLATAVDLPDVNDGDAIAAAVADLDDQLIPLLLRRRALAGRLYGHPSHRLTCERAASIRYADQLGTGTGPEVAAILHRQAHRVWAQHDA